MSSADTDDDEIDSAELGDSADTVDDDEIDAAELGDSFISQRIRIFLKTFWLDLACLFEAARLAYEADQRGATELNESLHFAVMKYPRAVLSYLPVVVT